MSARYKEIARAEIEALEHHKKMQPKFNTTKPLEKYFHKAIELIFAGQMDEATLRGLGIHKSISKINDFYLKIHRSPEEVEKCKNAFLHLYNKKALKLIEDEEILGALFNAMSMSIFWVREFESWEKNSHNIHKQFSNILRHMFAKYPVPLFLDASWYGFNGHKHIDWFIHLGLGKSAKELNNFPVAMTKKLAHEFINSPEGYTINEAIRRAQVISMGGNEWLAWHIGRSTLGHTYSDDAFWSTVILFFCKSPMFDYEHIPEILDYIRAQKTAMTRIQVEPGLFRPVLAYPNYSMKGRTLEALIRESQDWHNRIAQETKHTKTTSHWESTKFKTSHWKEGSEEKGTEKRYTVKELLKASELVSEGRRMHNCVSSYAGSCQSGHCSIWSLRVESQYAAEDSLLTIEVINASKTIVQVRGKSNCRPSLKERSIVEKWAVVAGLRISNGACGGW